MRRTHAAWLVPPRARRRCEMDAERQCALNAEQRAAVQREVDAAFAAADAAASDAAAAPAGFAPQTDPVALQLHAALKRLESLEVENAALRVTEAELETARRDLATARLKCMFSEYVNIGRLNAAMRNFNCSDALAPDQRDGPHCGCEGCDEAGRDPEQEYPPPLQCLFVPVFQALLRELDITWSVDHDKIDDGALNSLYMQTLAAEDEYYACSPVDADLVADALWVSPQFGRRVWAASSAEDVSLAKIQRLIDRLHRVDQLAALIEP